MGIATRTFVSSHRANLFAEDAHYKLFQDDAFEWLAATRPNSVHAVVTDPPYGLVEYTSRELDKMKSGKGGVWRIPPSFDGCQRRPLPRFTVLKPEDHQALRKFFTRLASSLIRVLVPGGHIFIATNPPGRELGLLERSRPADSGRACRPRLRRWAQA